MAGEVGGVICRAEGATAVKVQCVRSNDIHSLVARPIYRRKGLGIH